MKVSGHIQVEGCGILCAACQGARCIAHLLRISLPIDDPVCSVSGRRVNIAYPLHDPMVIKIAEKHNKHPAQVQSLLPHLKAFTATFTVMVEGEGKVAVLEWFKRTLFSTPQVYCIFSYCHPWHCQLHCVQCELIHSMSR